MRITHTITILLLACALVCALPRGSGFPDPAAPTSVDEARRALKASFDFWMKGDLEGALPLAQAAAAFDPGLRYDNDQEGVHLLASARLGYVYLERGKLDQAERWFRTALQYTKGPRTLLWLARIRRMRAQRGELLSPLALRDRTLPADAEYAPHSPGATFILVRAFSQGLGATVSWDEATQSATATLGEKSINGERSRTITFTLGSETAVVSDQWSVASPTTDNQELATQEVALRVAPYLNEEWRMMVPLRPLVEALGGTVEWEPEAQIVYVTLPSATTSEMPPAVPWAVEEETG